MATPAQVKAFIDRIAPIAQYKAKGRSKWSLPSVCIAQCCWESGYGTSPKMVRANAILGIKVGKSKAHFGNHWHDKAYSTKTKECYDGNYVQITDMFRAYDSLDDSIGDYYDMLSSCSRYKACLNEPDPLKCITAIKNGGYATGLDYANNIMSLIKKYNLTQYDSVVTGKNENGTGAAYCVDKLYKLQSDMYVRDSAAGNKKPFLKMTANAKNHAFKDSDGYGILKKGTAVTCKGIQNVSGAVWIKIPSGWVCGIGESGKVYIR